MASGVWHSTAQINTSFRTHWMYSQSAIAQTLLTMTVRWSMDPDRMRGRMGRSEFWYNRLILCRRKTGRVIGYRPPKVGPVGRLFVSLRCIRFPMVALCMRSWVCMYLLMVVKSISQMVFALRRLLQRVVPLSQSRDHSSNSWHLSVGWDYHGIP